MALNAYYNRSSEEADKGYERHMFRAGYVLQSSEMNEVQDSASRHTKSIGDALFVDGDVVRDARIVIDKATGATMCESGAIYLRGAVRGVPPGQFTIPTSGTVLVGIYLAETIVTEVEDPDLMDPAGETRNYGEPGAARLRVDISWGFTGDGQAGEFYPVYYVDDGEPRGSEEPPVLDNITQAIAKYDRDSTLSNYVVSGMRVSPLPAAVNGDQVYDIAEGRARVNGYAVDFMTSRRVVYPAAPVLKFIDSEPKTSDTLSLQRVLVDRPPLKDITQVRITREKVENITRGPAAGTGDTIPDTSVVEIVQIVQGGTTYVKGVDYKLTAGQVDWSLSGAEPTPGSTYACTYRHIATVTPQDVDNEGFSVLGAVPGTLILTNYNTMLPRIDRLCLNDAGQTVWIEGVSTDFSPVRPPVPSALLALAQVHQYWDSRTRIVNDGTRVVSMDSIERYGDRLDLLTDLIAQNTLVTDLSTREAIAMKGVFVDPFLDDTHRDQGIPQGAAIFDGACTMSVAPTPVRLSNDVVKATYCDYVLEPIIEQPARTASMKINPYMSFGVPPSPVTLNPAVDRWVETETIWSSPVTRQFNIDSGWGDRMWTNTVSTTGNEKIGESSRALEFLREIFIEFTVEGFGPNEEVIDAIFDGMPITPDPI